MPEVAALSASMSPRGAEKHSDTQERGYINSLCRQGVLTLSLLCASADRAVAQEQSPTSDTQANVSLMKTEEAAVLTHDERVRLWIDSVEGKNMKEKLQQGLAHLDDPDYAERQKSTEEIMRILKELADKIYPFPEELRSILGPELFPHRKYDEHLQQTLRRDSNHTADKARRLSHIQSEWNRESVKYPPRILPGTYSMAEVRAALESQTGICMAFLQGGLGEKLHIQEGKNSWGDVLNTVTEGSRKNRLTFDSTMNALTLDERVLSLETVHIEGAYLYVVHTNRHGDEVTSVWRPPSIGSFIGQVHYSNRHHVMHPSERSRSLMMHILYEVMVGDGGSLQQCTIDADEKICIPVAAVPIVESVPFDEIVPLGRLQTMRALKEKRGDTWATSIHRECNNDKFSHVEKPCDNRVQRQVSCETSFQLLDASGKEIPHETVYENRVDALLLTAEEPASIGVRYTGDVRRVTVPRLHEARLRRSQNP